MTREHNPAMGPCDVPTPYPCLTCGRHTKYPGYLCSYCGGRSAVRAPEADPVATEDAMTPARFMAAFCEKTGAHLSVCGATKPLSWDAALEILVFGYKIISKPRASDAPPLPEIREEDVALIRDDANRNLRSASDRCHETGKQYARILAVLEAVSARKGGGNG